MKKTRAKFYAWLILSALILLFLYFLPFSWNLVKSILTHQSLSMEDTYLIAYDYVRQGIPYYREFYRLIDSGEIFWSWNSFLGNSFYTSKALFLIMDPYAWIGYFLYKVISYLPTVQFLMTGLRLLGACVTCSMWVRKLGRSDSSVFLFSLLFMLSGWTDVFLEQIQFLSFYSFIPLFLAGLEEMLQKLSGMLLLIASFLCACTNFYLFWPLGLFGILYWIVRWGQIHGSLKQSHFFRHAWHAFGVILLGIGLAGFLVVPALSAMMKSPRLSASLNHYSWWSFTNVCAIMMSFLIPVIRGPHLLYHDYWYYFYQIGTYAGTISLLSVPQAVRGKKWNRLLLIAVLLTFAAPQFGLVFHLSYSLRYSFFAVLCLVMLGSEALDQNPDCNLLKKTVLWILILIAALGIVIPLVQKTDVSSGYPELVMLASAALMILLEGFLWRNRHRRGMMIAALAEALVFGNVSMQSAISSGEEAEYLAYDSEIQKIMEALRERDDSFFRVDLNTGYQADQNSLANAGMYYGIPSLSSYDSLYEPSLHDYLAWTGFYPDVNWQFNLQDPGQFALLDAKYSICSPKYSEAVRNDEPIFSTEHFNVYRNESARGMAFSADALSEESLLNELAEEPEKNHMRIMELLEKTAVVPDENYDRLLSCLSAAPEFSSPEEWSSTDMKFTIHNDAETFWVFSIPDSDGWSVTINGADAGMIAADGGFIGLVLPSGTSRVVFHYAAAGLAQGIWVSAGSAAFLTLLAMKKKKALRMQSQ